ncbi:hypothetical protein B0T19DRAFT_265460 [Cercophora scortea]|uniref:Calponin-homology (CH) domain-containing protein n=1 Tax=Cercophora scortea TaxID=314031 RepID=A0AAE0IAN4_9PEZI|nr:hypothetical protein B0T19DRAFT_265460 [Cercophora scortea]
MALYSPSTQAALLKWVNSFDTTRKADVLEDLQDGIILGQVLEQMLSPEFSSAELIQNPSTWEENKQNLETLYRGLVKFLRTDNPVLAPSPSQFRAIAENPDENALCEFISAFLTAACLGSLSRTYIPRVMDLDKATQGEIAKIIDRKNKLKAEREGKEDGDTSKSKFGQFDSVRDPDLLEEELYQTKDKYEALKKQNADLQSRIDKLLDTREAVLHDLRVAQDELSAQQKSRGNDATTAIKDLRNEVREKIDEIDRLEALFEKESSRTAKLEKENENLRAKTQKLKDLQDKVTVLEHDTKQQQQQIKGLENYKKKAQDLAIVTQRNTDLQEHVMQLQQDLKDYDHMRSTNIKLQKEIAEKTKALATNEQEIIYTIQSRNVLQDSNEELKRRLEYLESSHQLDESRIRELEEQLQLGGTLQPGSHSPGASTSKFNLEQELETTTDPAVTLRLEVGRLKAENNLLRNNMTVASENDRLRAELDAANQKVEMYRSKCIEATEKHAIAQEQVNALVNNMTGEGDALFVNMRKDLLSARRDLEQNTRKIEQLETEAADRNRELLQLRTDLSAIGEDQSSALTMLKSSDELISASLKSELDAARKQLSSRASELEELKEQLMNALVSKDKIRKQLDDTTAAAGPATPGEPAPKGKKEDAEKIEKLKTALRQKIEQLEKSEQDKYDLQRRLKAAENGGAQAAQKVSSCFFSVPQLPPQILDVIYPYHKK